MPEIKKLLWRNRFFLEILGIVVAGEFLVMLTLDYLLPNLSALNMDLLDAITLTLLVAPFIYWRSHAVHGREAQNLSAAVQHSSTAVLLLDTVGRIYWFNAGFTQMSGYSLDEAIGQTPAELLDSGQTDAHTLATLQRSLARHEPCRAIVCNRHKNGAHYFVDIDYRPDYDKHGKLLGFIEICTDITELTLAKRALEASLRESEALRHTVETHAIVSVVDHGGRIIDANPAFCAISGYSREQLLGQDHRILNSGTHSPEFWSAMWDEISQGRPWRGEICNRNSRGQLYWVDSMIAPFLGADGLVEKYVSMRVDITERKANELLLSDAQERVRLATESAGIGIWSLNPISGEQSWDAQQYRLFGLPYDPEAAAPIYDLWSRHLHPADAKRAEATFQQSLQDGVPFEHQFRIIRPDGAVRHIKALGSPRLAADGRVEYIVGTNMDVTDAILLAATMQEARERAEEASQTQAQFLANMSHEIRTPMNAVMGMLKLLGASELNTLQRNYIDNAQLASRMMMHLIDDILEHAQLSSGKVLLLPKVFRLDAVLQVLSELVSVSLGSKEVDVLFDLDPHLPVHLFGDSQRLQQVLVNLLSNAMKFTLAGEVVCRIHLQEQQGQCSRLVFSIQDTGIGITPKFRERIFQSFTQVQASTTRAFGGIGLGLPISQRLVELMGGRIVLESEVGVGSCFSFSLDLAMPDDISTRQAAIPAQAAPESALVVDDGQTSLCLICALAGSLHWRTAGAATGAQALEQICSGLAEGGTAFSLILLDWNLPDVDISHLVQQIRSLYRTAQQQQPRIILLRHNANPVYQKRLLEMADLVDASLAKPFTAGMLQAALARVDIKLATPEAVKQERLQRLKGLRVLAVDDVAINQTVIEQLLKSEGALVTLAANGRLGADAVLSAPAGQGFDVVLMDIQMPVMDGYEATRLIRSAPQLAQLPIIAVTANVLDADRARCIEAGMNHHVGKPYDLDELVAVICSLTGRQRAVPDAIPALPQPGTAHSSAAVVTAQPMHAYWIRATALQIVPDLVTLLKQGVLLQVLDSVESLESLLAAGAPAGLLVLDRATVTSAALHASGRSSNGASMKVMPMIALADAPTEEEMLACRRAGVVDMVPHQFALKYLPEIGKRYLDEQGVPRVDLHQNIAAIDSRRAMAHMQADAVFFGSLLRAFFDELPGRTKQFQDDWSGNAQQLKHHSHSLKGLARTLGLHELAEVAVQIEVQGAQGASPDAALLTQLVGELESAGFQILRWLHVHQDAAGAQP